MRHFKISGIEPSVAFAGFQKQEADAHILVSKCILELLEAHEIVGRKSRQTFQVAETLAYGALQFDRISLETRDANTLNNLRLPLWMPHVLDRLLQLKMLERVDGLPVTRYASRVPVQFTKKFWAMIGIDQETHVDLLDREPVTEGDLQHA